MNKNIGAPKRLNLNITPDMLEEMDDLSCPFCNGDLFITTKKYKALSAIHPINPTRQEVQIELSALTCLECKNSVANPKDLQIKKKIYK